MPLSLGATRDRSAAAASGGTILFAHSIGAVPAVLAVAETVEVTGLVLVEPALYDIARGDAAIERHIAVVTEARAQPAAGDLRTFWAILRPLMFAGIPTLVVTGGWNAEYETIAQVLAARGAEHRVLSGAGHRPQDVVSFADLVSEFESV